MKTVSQWMLGLGLIFLLATMIFLEEAHASTFLLITPVSTTADINGTDASNTLDANPNEFTAPTYWQAAADPEACIIYDVGQPIQIAGFRETSGPFPANPFSASVSLDNVSFAPVASGTLTQFAFGEHLVTPVSARYIKLCLQRTDSTGFGELADFRVLTPGEITVQIDIKPGSYPNCINNNGHGVIPVAILGSVDFDVSTINAMSITLDGAGVKVKGKSENAGSIEDINTDGYDDLVVQIIDVDGTYQPGDTVATLTGMLVDSTPIQGSDTICIVP